MSDSTAEVTGETITDEQIAELQRTLQAERERVATTPMVWTSHIDKAITETEWALCHDIVVFDRQILARARCAAILNARAATARAREGE